jgi:RNA recognition motif-containing protein
MSAAPGFLPCPMPHYTTSPALYGIGSCALEHSLTMANPTVSYPSGPGYTQQYATSQYSANSYGMSNYDMTSRDGKKYHVDEIPTQRRKIIIRRLQPWANESQLRDLIRHKAGSDVRELQKLDMPLADGQPGSNRGYALATFETEEAAEKVIKRLNNYQYDGRALEVKHTKEGVSDHPPSHSSHPHSSSHQRQSHHSHHSRCDRHDDKDRGSKERGSSQKATISSDKKSKSSSSKSDVVIAHGSSVSHI